MSAWISCRLEFIFDILCCFVFFFGLRLLIFCDLMVVRGRSVSFQCGMAVGWIWIVLRFFFWFWSNGMKHETGTSIREEESERMRLLETVAMLFESFFFFT